MKFELGGFCHFASTFREMDMAQFGGLVRSQSQLQEMNHCSEIHDGLGLLWFPRHVTDPGRFSVFPPVALPRSSKRIPHVKAPLKQNLKQLRNFGVVG